MPTTWAEWKHKTSLLDNQWRWFRDPQPKAATTKPSLFCSPPVVTSTTAASSSSSSSLSKPSTTTMPPAPQPMDLDRTNPVKKDLIAVFASTVANWATLRRAVEDHALRLSGMLTL